MKPTRALWRAPADLLAADTASLAAATAMHLHLAKASFVPGLDLILADLTEADFTGATAIALGTGAQPVFYDVATGNLSILLKPPVGGFVWTCTADPVSPQTIYGCYLTDTADAVLWGAFLLPQPVSIAAAGQGIIVQDPTLQFGTESPF